MRLCFACFLAGTGTMLYKDIAQKSLKLKVLYCLLLGSTQFNVCDLNFELDGVCFYTNIVVSCSKLVTKICLSDQKYRLR